MHFGLIAKVREVEEVLGFSNFRGFSPLSSLLFIQITEKEMGLVAATMRYPASSTTGC